MNQFGKHVRSTTFNLSLRSAAITELLNIEVLTEGRYGVSIWPPSLANYLHTRGLIGRPTDETCQCNWALSEAGALLCPLLRHAGFKSEYAKAADGSISRHNVEQLAQA